ncbi:MAG: transglutaminase TgpA family protein [Burkholderiaceae bacterium]
MRSTPVRPQSFMRILLRLLSRPLSRDKADTLLLLATCALVIAPHAFHIPGWSTALCGILLAWRGWITFRGNRMPPRWILVPIAVLAIAGVYWSYRTFFGREPGVAMLVLLLALKLLEMRAKRDLFVVVFLSFFLILTQFFYSQSILSALTMFASVILVLAAQLSFQYTGIVPPLRQRLFLSGKIFILAIPLTLVLFLLFPRIQGPLWGLPSDAQSGRTGLSSTMSPGNISKLAMSEEIAFRVKFLDAPAPKQDRLYWRGPVLGEFDGRNWTPLPSRMNQAGPVTVRPGGAPIKYQVTMEPSNQRSLFALELVRDMPQVAGNPSMLTPDLQILTKEPITQRIRYDASSSLDYVLQAGETERSLRNWLYLPAGYNPAALEYAARLRRQVGQDGAIVNAVLRFFREEKFSYTLEPPALGRNTVDEFLFTTRAGFCEHYSSAFVVLMRAAGIPARVVTGYQGGEINAVDGFMTVRQSDAHAWAEVWLANRGWVRVDPTSAVAPARVTRNLGTAIPSRTLGGLITLDRTGSNAWLSGLRSMRHNWDALNNAWNQWVLDYSLAKQQSLLQSLGFANADWRTLALLLSGFGSLVLILTALPLVRNRVRIAPADALYAAFCKRMAQRGFPRAPHEGPRAYRARLADAGPDMPVPQRTAAARFLEVYEAARYAPAPKQSGKAHQASLIAQLKSLLSSCR